MRVRFSWLGRGVIHNSITDVKGISLDDVKNIYRELYWSVISGDLLPESLSMVVFDKAVNSGA